MFAISVSYRIHKAHVASFREAILRQAANSRQKEPWCRQFDVCFDDDDPQSVFLYEVYDDRPSIDAHRQTEHFQQFVATISDWVESKEARIWRVADDAPSGG